jgi:hypothetical protein
VLQFGSVVLASTQNAMAMNDARLLILLDPTGLHNINIELHVSRRIPATGFGEQAQISQICGQCSTNRTIALVTDPTFLAITATRSIGNLETVLSCGQLVRSGVTPHISQGALALTYHKR